MAITFLDEEEDIVATAEPTKGESRITFLDEEGAETPAVEPTEEPVVPPATERPRITFLDEEPEAPAISGLAVPPAPEVPKFEPVKPSEGVLRQAADLPVQFAIGINNSVKGLSDLFGADNPVSQNLSQNVDWYRGLLSAASKQDEEEVGRILQEAENKGLLDQLGAGLEAFSVAPADFVASGLGSLAVFAAGGLAGRAAGLGAKGIQAVQAGLGAGMGAGIVKGEIYQSVKDEMLAQGKTEEEAKSVAMEAQSFGGKNLDQILVAAGLGAVDAFTGAEKIIGKVLAKGGLKPEASRIGNILKTGISEAVPEFAQAAQEKFASNLALNREGVNVPLTQGVFSQGALEGLVGLGLGVGAGAIEPRIQTEPTKEEVAAAASETQDVARQSMDVAPATASLVEGEAEQIIKAQAETPDERVARLQREAQEAAGEIELEEEGAGLPPVEPTPPVTPTPEAAVAPVEPQPIVTEETPPPAPDPTIEAAAPPQPTVAGFTTAKGSTYEVTPEGKTIRTKRSEGRGQGETYEPHSVLFVPSETNYSILSDMQGGMGDYSIRMGYSEGNRFIQVTDTNQIPADVTPQIAIVSRSTQQIIPNGVYDAQRNPEVGFNPVEKLYKPDGTSSTHLGNQITEIRPIAEVAPAEVEPTPVAQPPVTPQLEPLRRVVKAEQTEEDVAGLVDAGFAEVYKGQPVLTQAGLDALPEAERPRLTHEARKIQIDTRTSEAAAEAISKNLRIGVDQVPVDVRMPAGWTLEGDVYVPPTVEAAPVAPQNPEITEYPKGGVGVEERLAGLPQVEQQRLARSQFTSIEEYRKAFDRWYAANKKQVDVDVAQNYLPEQYEGERLHRFNRAVNEWAIANGTLPPATPAPTPEVREARIGPSITAQQYQPFDQSILTRSADFARGIRGGVVGGVGSTEGATISRRSESQQRAFIANRDRLNELLDDRGAFQRNVVVSRKEGNRVLAEERYLEISDENNQPLAYVRNGRLGVGGGVRAPSDIQFVAPNVKVEIVSERVAESRAETPSPIEDIFDAREGIGQVPFNVEIGYRGFVKYMTPSEFRSLVPKGVSGPETKRFVVEALGRGEKLGQPFLNVTWNEADGVWEVTDHEGRSRADAILEVYGNVPIPVHMFPRELRATDITDQMRNASFISQADRQRWKFDVTKPYVKPISIQTPQEIIRERRRVQMGRAGMETSAVEARLQELGFPTGGIIRVVNQPDADFEGRTIILDGKVTGIELNASALKDNAAIDRVLNHEFAESANADGALNKLVERLTPKEKKEINDTITRLRYEERARTTEEAARAIEALAEAWRGRGFFTRAVARVEAWASRLGFKLTRRAAEYIAARNLADINSGFRTAYNQFINVTGDERLSRAYKMGVPTQEELDARKAKLPKYTSEIKIGNISASGSGRPRDTQAIIDIYSEYGKPVGRAVVVKILGENESLTVFDTNVNAQFRGRGYGEALYREIAKFAQQNGLKTIYGGIVSRDAQRVREKLFETKSREIRAVDSEGEQQIAMESNVNPDIRYARREVRESRREPEAIPTFTEGTPEAATLKEMAASMAKVDAASEAKGGKPETYKISEIASVWMDSGLGERELQDAIVEYTNLTPANAARVAKAIAKQYGLQQQIAETGAVIAEITPEPEGAPRKSAVTKLIEQTTGVRKPVVKLQVSESAALKKQIQLKAREARETRKARKEAAEELAKSITDYVKANPIRGPINSRQAMSITKKALKLDVNNEAAVDRFEMYVERVIENANYDRDLSDARALIKRAKAFAKSKDTQGNVKTTLEAIANVAPALLDNPFEFNLVVQRYLLGLAPVTAKQYAVMPDADVRRYLESLETQIKDNQEVLDRAKAQRILDKQAAYAEEKGIPLDEAIAILNSEEFLQEKTIEKLEDLTKLLTAMAQESQKDVKAYDDAGATPKQKELISFMRKVNLDSLINEEKKRYIRFANNLLANGATFGMEQFQSIALGQEAAMKAVKDRRLSDKLSAWISPIGGDKAIDTARRIALRTQSEADTFKNIFGREAVGAFRNILGLNRLDVAQTDSNRAKEQIANEFGEYFKGLRKKYGDDATGFEAKGYAGIAGYLIQTDGNKTEAESIPYRRRLMEQNIVELRKSDKQSDLAEADLKERALAQLTGATNAEILSQLKALNPASYEQLMWVKDVMLPKWRDFLKEHDENFRNQANNYNNPDHLTITYKFPEGQLLPSEMEDVYQQDMIGMRIKQAANSIKRKDHPNLPVSKTGTIANIDINFGYNQYNALVDQVDKAFVAPAWEQVVAFTKAPEFEQVMGGRANALFVKNLLRDIQTSRSRQSITDDEAQLIAGGVRLARKISTQAVLGGITQPLRQVPDQLAKLFFTTGRFDLIIKNLLSTAQAAPLLNKFPIGRRGDAQAGTQYASQFSELARKVEASVTDRKWAKYRELMNKVGEFWMTPLRGSDVWAAKVSWMSYYEAELNKKGIKMESWEREAELVDTDQDRKEAASYAEFAVDFYGGASDPTKMASLSKQTNNGWKEFAKLVFLPLNSFALQQKNSLISDLRDAYLRTGDRKASIAAIAGTLAGMAAFHGMRIYIIGGLIYPAGKALLMGIFGIDMDEPDEEEKQKQLKDNWRKFKASMYGNIIAGGAGEFAEKAAIDAVNRTAYLWDANINPDSLLNDKGEIMSFRQYEKEVSPLYRFRSYGSSEYSFGLADVLTEQATHALAETQQLMTPEEMEKYTGNEQAYAAFATAVEWMYFFRLMDTDVKRIATDLKRQMDKGVEEREKQIKAIREGR